MKKFIRDVCKIYVRNEAAQQGLTKIIQMKEHPGWPELIKVFHIIRGFMGQEMFGRKFSQLTLEEKDIRQRTYAGINEFLEFLENPTVEIQNALYLEGHEERVKNLIDMRKRKTERGRKEAI